MTEFPKNLVTGVNGWVKYHDDMNERGATDDVQVIAFPFMDLFGDFRLFNGISLKEMDDFIGRIKEIMVEIANTHARNDREEKLREQQKGGV